ncbi:MAG: acyl carrier protein [gamma proteobacterium symbiont of Taylorina sp.]|nr:acyl carrier protein [gamma proteobacterium symbiont of Taylorina sp.]
MDKLEGILCEVFRLKQEDLNDELTMGDIERWDSLTHMDLVTSIEEGLDIQLTMDDIMNMKDIKIIKSIISVKIK